jgi:6-pyruvoyl-tetrahydropterin synthase
MVSLFVENITNLDFSFLSKNRGLLGETWLVDITLTGELNNQGMIFDFSEVKKQIKNIIDTTADHKLLVPIKCSRYCPNEQSNQDYIDFVYKSDTGNLHYKAPKQAVCFISATEITINSVTKLLLNAIKQHLPVNISDIKLNLYQEPNLENYFHYSHGLKKHQGDCQRMAHGHRSRLEIKIDNKREHALETYWCKKWQDIYLVSEEDISNLQDKNNDYLEVQYSANQGNFYLKIAKNNCYMINSSSTVELLAFHLAKTIYYNLKQQHTVEVKLFEGYQKGAIGYFKSEQTL